MIYYKTVLVIAGSDSGGGAGLQADIKTCAALGTYATTAITAVTAQNTRGVQAVETLSPRIIATQIDAIFIDMGTDAVKIGMLANAKIIEAVAERLNHYRPRNIVLDPVMVAQSGDRLLDQSALTALREKLIPLAHIMTPNLPEAAALLNRDTITEEDMEDAAKALLDLGCPNVLIKGGHSDNPTESRDYFLSKESNDGTGVFLSAPRIDTRNTHGTGCTLASAIAAHLAKGHPMPEAVSLAKEYLTGAINAGREMHLSRDGTPGPVHHLHAVWKSPER